MSDPNCSDCIHAAFDSGGVWCKEFGEQILNERVAEECGAFEVSAPVIHLDGWGRPVLFAVSDWERPEQARTVSLQVDIEYFGKEEHGSSIHASFERNAVLHYGEKVRVKRL